MSQLAIRNLSGHALELARAERFDGERARAWLGGRRGAAAVARGSALDARDVALALPPFATARADVPAPPPAAAEVLRLTLRAGGHGYEVDVAGPARGSASAAARKLDGGPLDLAVVYLPAAALVAVLASPPLEAWMRALGDDWPLALLSIPGTHNSPTCHRALPSVRCQAVDVADQLRHGVRFLDVRVSAGPDNDALALVHSAFPISLAGNKYFGDMLGHVYRFLAENPSETVLMSVKREGTGKATDGQLAKHLKRGYVDRDPDRWWTEPAVPTLGRARGKIVLVRRFALDDDMRRACWDGRGWAIDAQQWPDNCEDGTGGDGGCFRIQDFYEVSRSQTVDVKIRYSCRQLERAAEQVFALPSTPGHHPDGPVPPLFVNFLTASNFFNAAWWPDKIAAKVNPAVLEYLCTTHGEEGKGPAQLGVGCAATGIVVTDWVGADDWDLIRCIVAMNARLQHPV